jgi:hypothetical protein
MAAAMRIGFCGSMLLGIAIPVRHDIPPDSLG